MLNLTTKAALLILLTASATALADADSIRLTDSARVFSSVPVYTTVKEVTPREECWTETVTRERHIPAERRNDAAPVVVGGVIGGALGHAVGHGHSNKKLGAVVGSVLGAAVGHSVASEREVRPERTAVTYDTVERCKMVEETQTRRVFEGFDVTYEYRGEVYTTRMPREPGKTIELAIEVTPLG